MIEIISQPEEEYILKKCVSPHILRMSYNPNGTHIIQKLIARFEEENREYLNNFIIENLVKMCMNANGICVVNKILILFRKKNSSIQIRTPR